MLAQDSACLNPTPVAAIMLLIPFQAGRQKVSFADRVLKISYMEKMDLYPITPERLSQMQDILNRSAGYAVNIADEIEYFDPAACAGWWLAMGSDGNPMAFIRHFKQNFDWSLGEIYIGSEAEDRTTIAKALLGKFQNSIRFPNAHRLRFDVNSYDQDLNCVLKAEGFSEKAQIFRFFEYSDMENATLSDPEYASVSDAKGVAETLSNLHPVSSDEARRWIEDKNILIVRDHERVVAAAQIYEFDDALEVNRFATHEKYLRRGFARRLMNTVFQESTIRSKKRVYLKVEENRAPAIDLYLSVGFEENRDKCQTWHSRWY